MDFLTEILDDLRKKKIDIETSIGNCVTEKHHLSKPLSKSIIIIHTPVVYIKIWINVINFKLKLLLNKLVAIEIH